MSEASGSISAILTQVGDNRELDNFSSVIVSNYTKWTAKTIPSAPKLIFIQNLKQACIRIET